MTACTTLSPSFKGKLYAAADGFGTDLKNAVIDHLRQQQIHVEDLGTEKYFVAAEKVSREVQKSGRQAGDINQPETVRGFLFCGSGMGVAIMANKFQGVAAAVVENEHAARCSRAINDTNIICLGGKVTPIDEAKKIVDAWMQQEFGKAPCSNGGEAPEWWSNDVEGFLNNKWPEVHAVEEKSRKAM